MASSVDVANDALSLLGAGRIISFNDDTTQARLMTQIYEAGADSVVSSYPWPEAKVQVELAPLVDVPVYNYEYAFQLPTDPKLLRLLEVYDDSKRSLRDTDWEIVGDRLYANQATVKITYIARIDAGKYSSLLRSAIAAYLAYTAAYALVQSNTVQSQMFQLYKDRLQDARINARLQSVGNQYFVSQLDDVRR